MHIVRLELRGVRRFEALSLAPCPGLNLITGDNGAGKTSVLEAMHLMAYGRSFRGRVRDGLIRAGSPAVEVFVEWSDGASATHPTQLVGDMPDAGVAAATRKAGLRHSGADWDGKLDGRAVSQLGELCAALSVVTFEPGSHALVTGSADNRRRYLDWGLFHVEPEFLGLWRRYARALKQRNALLKSRAPGRELDAWDQELVDAGEPLSHHRQAYMDVLAPYLAGLGRDLVPGVGVLSVEYLPGWRREDLPLADALLLARDRDHAAGYTSVGPHRADWRIGFSGLPGREALSRGQAKLVAMAALLAQAEQQAMVRGGWPVVALDDLASELDRDHQRRVLERLLTSRAQVFITGTEQPAAIEKLGVTACRFHIEDGLIERR